MEICVRYYQFFEQNPHLIPKVLENFVTLTHSNHVKVRSRSWYLFQRLVKHLRSQLGNVSYDVIQAVADLLAIKAELPDNADDDMSSDEDDQSAESLFNASCSSSRLSDALPRRAPSRQRTRDCMHKQS